MKVLYRFDLDRMMYKELTGLSAYVHRAAAPEFLGKIYGHVYSKLVNVPEIEAYMNREVNEVSEYYAKRNIQIQSHFQDYFYPLLKRKPDSPKNINFMSYWEPNTSGNTIIEIAVHYNDNRDEFKLITITDENVLDHFDLHLAFKQDRTQGYGEAEDEIYTMFNGDDYYFQHNVFPTAPQYEDLNEVMETGSCRNFTFQVTEDCNLRCFGKGTKVLMFDYTEKNIEDVQVGDYVLGFDVNQDYNSVPTLYATKVVHTFAQFSEVYALSSKDTVTYVTPNHEYLTTGNEWREIGKLDYLDGIYYVEEKDHVEGIFEYDLDRSQLIPMTVYNLETESHTYVANRNLVHNCSYCYQINKCASIMDLETAKSAVDDLLAGNFDYLSPGFSKSVILEFIGGDPLLEIDLICQIYEYFLQEAYRLNHPWFYHHRISMCTNAMLYFSENTKRFFDRFARQVSFNVSIDGNKALHDSCRIQPTGEGSYDIGIAAVHHSTDVYKMDMSSKMTLAPSNVAMIAESVKNLCFDNKYPGINLNCVFEDVWSVEDAKVLYDQLIRVADMVYEQKRPDLFFSIYRSLPLHNTSKNVSEVLTDTCGGGNASMLSISPDGTYYPCIRYMPSSLGDDMKAIVIGNHVDKMDQHNPVLREFTMISYVSQQNDKCLSCPFLEFCGSCTALCYQYFGTANQKATTLCDMARAQYLAAVYYWSKIKLLVPEFHIGLDDNIAPYYHFRDIVSKEEYDRVMDVYHQAKSTDL